MKFSLLTAATSILAMGQLALSSPLISARQSKALRCDLGNISTEADTATCVSEGVSCNEVLGVVISVGTPTAYDCLQKCGCD
ncbi:hypothetical protein B0T21DRAFT_205335 [Apiosordaria backusii]|uniref:Uncharacterized protein n=1 Tax=Apiosordaria backusii TaxID=314023 RepID=A0AA40B7E5_9PEZI|nr:hypothetical protein B0T21DRAFT_205335 [Apiosordaria backusii]